MLNEPAPETIARLRLELDRVRSENRSLHSTIDNMAKGDTVADIGELKRKLLDCKTYAQLLQQDVERERETALAIAEKFKDMAYPRDRAWVTPQVGGQHYEGFGIQPIEFIEENNIRFSEGCAIKYIARHTTTANGNVSLLKAIDYIQKVLKAVYGVRTQLVLEPQNEVH